MLTSQALAPVDFQVAAIRSSSADWVDPEAISLGLPAQAQEDAGRAEAVAPQAAVVVVAEAVDSRQAGAGEEAFKAAVHAAEAVDAVPEDGADAAGNRTRL
jgi:hypothetical protein